MNTQKVTRHNWFEHYSRKKAIHIGRVTPYDEIHKPGLHWSMFHHKSPFAKAACCALVIGVGDLLATGADLMWLAGDMSRDTHNYHLLVAVGLILAFLTMVGSFIYLYHSCILFLNKQHNKERQLKLDNKALTARLESIEAKLNEISRG